MCAKTVVIIQWKNVKNLKNGDGAINHPSNPIAWKPAENAMVYELYLLNVLSTYDY